MNGQPKVAKTSLATYAVLRALANEAGRTVDVADLVDYAYARLDSLGSKTSFEAAVRAVQKRVHQCSLI